MSMAERTITIMYSVIYVQQLQLKRSVGWHVNVLEMRAQRTNNNGNQKRREFDLIVIDDRVQQLNW